MGFRGISPFSLLLILVIIVAFFGTSKIKTIGTDLAEAIKNFRRAMNDEDSKESKLEDTNPL